MTLNPTLTICNELPAMISQRHFDILPPSTHQPHVLFHDGTLCIFLVPSSSITMPSGSIYEIVVCSFTAATLGHSSHPHFSEGTSLQLPPLIPLTPRITIALLQLPILLCTPFFSPDLIYPPSYLIYYSHPYITILCDFIDGIRGKRKSPWVFLRSSKTYVKKYIKNFHAVNPIFRCFSSHLCRISPDYDDK